MCKVSVIIPYYNSENTIKRALKSVVEQTYSDFEIITIDDGSKDNSYNIVEEFKRNNKIRMKNIRQKNLGPSIARNIGIDNSTGEYIAFLDSDDSWEKFKLEKQVEIMDNNQEIAILGSGHYVCGNSNTLVKGDMKGGVKEITFNSKLVKNQFCTPSVIIRKDVIEKGNYYFNEDQKYAEDTLLYLKILRDNKGAKILEPLVILYKPEISSSGLSANLLLTEKYELRNFLTLYKENRISEKNKISIFKLMFLCVFSIMKFIRRILMKVGKK
ncbi:MAG: glycosyltransferase family 2 protein [Clostridium sp.]|nr:glycosyltransferase family 2 protein [Clostridium sp.]